MHNRLRLKTDSSARAMSIEIPCLNFCVQLNSFLLYLFYHEEVEECPGHDDCVIKGHHGGHSYDPITKTLQARGKSTKHLGQDTVTG